MDCEDCQKLIELEQRVEKLEKDNRRLIETIEILTRRLAAYENPHTPPSRQLFKRPPSGGEK